MWSYIVLSAMKDKYLVQRGRSTVLKDHLQWEHLYETLLMGFFVFIGFGGIRVYWEFGTLEKEMSSRQLNIQIKREVGLGVSNTEADSSLPEIII